MLKRYQTIVQYTADPTGVDNTYELGQQWINITTGDIFLLRSIAAGVATWQNITNASALTVHPSADCASVGANLDLGAAGDLQVGGTLDAVLLGATMRVVVKDQTDPIENGIYTPGSPATRVADLPAGGTFGGDFIFVTSGTVNAKTGWAVVGSGTTNTDAMVWNQFSAAGNYTGSNLGAAGANKVEILKTPAPTGADFQFQRMVGEADKIALTQDGTYITIAVGSKVVCTDKANTFASPHTQTFMGASGQLLTVDAANDKVGVRCAPISYDLDVNTTGRSRYAFIAKNAGDFGSAVLITGSATESGGLELHLNSADGGLGTQALRLATSVGKVSFTASNSHFFYFTGGRITINNGLHVGGTSDPGDNNLIVDGTAGIAVSAAEGNLHAAGSSAATTSVMERTEAANTALRTAFRIAASTSDGGGAADTFGPAVDFHIRTVGGALPGTPIGRIGCERITNNTSGELTFLTATTGSLTEKVRITKSGGVVIGATSTAAKFQVVGISGIDPSITRDAAATVIFTNNASSQFAFGVESSARYNLYIQGRAYTSATSKPKTMVLNPIYDSTQVSSYERGYVGIGLPTGSDVTSLLHVNGTISLKPTIINSGIAYTTAATAYEVTDADGSVIVARSSAAGIHIRYIKLPDPSTCIGRIYVIKNLCTNIAAVQQLVIIPDNTSDLIDITACGATEGIYTLSYASSAHVNQCITIQAVEANLWVVLSYDNCPLATYDWSA